jgi:hypothetical protein
MDMSMSENTPNAGESSRVYSIKQFCANNDISKSLLYLLWKRGDGPRYLDLGGRRKITVAAEAEWRRRMEAKSIKNHDG